MSDLDYFMKNLWSASGIPKKYMFVNRMLRMEKIKRIYDWMLAPQDTYQQMVNRFNFYKYFSEHDRRRGTNFIKTFPELQEFYQFCSNISLWV